MKTEKIEKLVLLEQSGELNFVRRWQLRRALARNPALKKFRDDLQQLTAVSRASGPADDLNPAVLGEIRRAAAEQSQQGFAAADISGAWLRPAIAMVAVFVVISGITLINQYRPPVRTALAAHFGHHGARWDDNIDAELSNVSSMLGANFDSGTDLASSDVNAMARELISLEDSGQ